VAVKDTAIWNETLCNVVPFRRNLLTLKIEAAGSSEIAAQFYLTTQYYIPVIILFQFAVSYFV
jgi:hypothetical protein